MKKIFSRSLAHFCLLATVLQLLVPAPARAGAVAVVAPQKPPAVRGLATALRAALDHHPAITGKEAEVTAKGYAIDSAKVNRYPAFSAQMSYEDELDESLGVVRLQQPLWAFGKIDRAITYAEADEVVEQNDLLQVKEILLRETAVAYARIEGIRRKIEVATDNIAKLSNLYGKIERRRQGLLASDADLQLIHTRLIQAKADLLRIEVDLTVAETELVALTRIKVASDTPVVRQHLLLFSDGPDLTVNALTRQVLGESATILHQESLITLARREKAQIQVSDMPTISLQVDHSFFDATDADNDETRARLVLEGVFNGLGFAAHANTKAAGARIVAARQALEQSRNEITRQIATLYQNRLLQQRLSISQEQSVAALEEVAESYMRQYEAGRKSWLEVLNMNRELNEEQLGWVEADNSMLVLTLELMALGSSLNTIAEGVTHE